MEISTVRISNFRSIKSVEVQLSDTTVFVGPNNSGKTAILDAIRIALTRAGVNEAPDSPSTTFTCAMTEKTREWAHLSRLRWRFVNQPLVSGRKRCKMSWLILQMSTPKRCIFHHYEGQLCMGRI